MTPVLIAIFRRDSDRASWAETSSSSIGTTRGSASSIVTSAPYSAKTSANSTPTAPAPITMIERSRVSLRTAPFEEMTFTSSIVTPGNDFGVEPVAMITARASSLSVPVAPATSTAVGETSLPRPGKSVILFFRNRNSTPFAMRSATVRLRFTAAA